MSTEPHGVARDQLRAFIERVERVEEEIATLNADKSDIYKEARAVGFDVKVLRKVVAKRKLDTHVREEQDAIFDMYWQALYGAPVHVHTHARENIEENRRSDGGVSILTKHEDIRTAPVTAEETPKQVYGDSVEDATAPPSQSVEIPAGRDQGHEIDGSEDRCPAELLPQSDDGAIVEVKGRARLANADGVEPSSSVHPADQPSKDQSNEVASSATRAGLADPTSVTGEGAANTALPDKPKVSYRPNCQHPENCASGTRDHCWSCRRAMQKSEEAA